LQNGDPNLILIRIVFYETLKGIAVYTPHTTDTEKKHVAVIGSGISGLSAAWLLSKTMQVTLYESEHRLGGHSNTVLLPTDNGNIPVDTGFIVYNERNYPNLVALFKEIGVETQESEMSFAVSLGGGAIEYSGSGLNGLIGQRRNVIRPRFWSMMRDVMRFYRTVPDVLTSSEFEDCSLGDYLDQYGYGSAFVNDHLLPMGAAIWSASAKEMRAYPLVAFVRFFVSHGLLSLKDRPQWRTVSGGSRNYVEKLAREISGDIRVKRAPSLSQTPPVTRTVLLIL
jgi:predicted NAD/FAD-binding protein